MPRFSSGTAQDDPICVDLTDNIRPPRRATIRVQAWPNAPGGARAKLELELATVEGTPDAFQARLVEAGLKDCRLRQIHGLALEPNALYNLVDALIPARTPKRGGAAASSSPATQVPPRQRRPIERIMLTVNPSFDLLAKVIAPEFTMAQGVKE